MKKFLRSLTAMAACAAMVAACGDSDDPTPPGPGPDPEGQKANTWMFDDGDEVEMGSVLAMEVDGNVFVFFSAEKGLTEAVDFGNAADMTQIVFPASLIGGEADWTTLEEDDVTQFLSMLPEFNEQWGFSINGYDKTVSEGKLAVSMADDVLSVKCDFVVEATGLKFSAYVQAPFGQNEGPGPEPEGSYYEYAGKTVELNSAYAYAVDYDGEMVYGISLTPTVGVSGDEIFGEEHQFAFMVDATSMYAETILDMETGISTFDVCNLPEGCMFNVTVVNNDMYISVPDESVTEGKVAMNFTNGTDGGYVLNLSGDIAFSDGNTLKFSCSSPLVMNQEDEPNGFLEYSVESRGINESASFLSGFYHQSTWDDSSIYTFSVSQAPSYLALGGNAFVEIYVGSEDLLNGEAFDVATTNLPFSFKIEYLDRENQTLVPVTVDNDHRAGASGYITFTPNYDTGLYDVSFNLFLNNGDITVSGNYAGEMSQRNIVYSNANEGPVAVLRSATLDLSSDPCVLYLSSSRGVEAGPNQYDIKCEVSAAEWKYDFLLSFSGSDSAITWDDVRYDKDSTTDKVIGGNWKVSTPVAAGSSYVAECQTTLFGMGNAYYYGEINIIK